MHGAITAGRPVRHDPQKQTFTSTLKQKHNDRRHRTRLQNILLHTCNSEAKTQNTLNLQLDLNAHKNQKRLIFEPQNV